MDNASSSTLQSSSSTAPPSRVSLADNSAPPSEAPRGRGRGKSRGGLGKYLRRAARLLLDGDKVKQTEEEDDEEQRERAQKYSRRKLGTNTDRYKEKSRSWTRTAREPILPPEIDLSSFLNRQLNVDVDAPILKTIDIDEDDVDHTLAHISSRGIANPNHGKGKIEEIEWDDDMDEMTREKAVADANRELTSRFRAKSENLKKKPIAPTTRERKQDLNIRIEASYVAAPALPTEQVRNPKDEMQDFLDDLLT
ncbi:hypothetical protein BDZ89DRAFT_1096158 [Hymenopellis radicata]|nr:hypothetical protein BDZ89DRAFT_1096158 [Hymenopellis radicata]